MGLPSDSGQKMAKMAHVNLMTDTIIANLPEEGLRSVLRSMLATEPSITPILEARTRDYLHKSASSRLHEANAVHDESGRERMERLQGAQQRIRAMLGCGLCYESIPLLKSVVANSSALPESASTFLCAVDGDIIQALTAVQKTLFTSSGSRPLQGNERSELDDLCNVLEVQEAESEKRGKTFVFERSLTALRNLLGKGQKDDHGTQLNGGGRTLTIKSLPKIVETFRLDGVAVPRLFSGLWQLSSPSWGVASTESIKAQFESYVKQGFTAYDMADHYGDAEVVFGNFRSSCFNPEAIFGATKYCIFTPTKVTREVVQANVTERCRRMSSDHVDLLQFHWQFYDDPQYLEALQYLQEDKRVRMLGLCNFDTQRMQEIIEAGVHIETSQVQFSLIDSRPMFKMGDLCSKHNVKLLTYGTLCGGFIAEKWLNKPEPELFLNDITPSQRKYYEMIVNWGGWDLFQELLAMLKMIAIKHDVSISNVATRWVLDFPYVGAVVVGTRMGVSGHAEENLKSYGWRLDEEDQAAVEAVLARGRRDQLIGMLGDCGGEYR